MRGYRPVKKEALLGETNRALTKCILEQYAILGQPIDIWRMDKVVSIATERVIALLIGRYPENIRRIVALSSFEQLSFHSPCREACNHVAANKKTEDHHGYHYEDRCCGYLSPLRAFIGHIADDGNGECNRLPACNDQCEQELIPREDKGKDAGSNDADT